MVENQNIKKVFPDLSKYNVNQLLAAREILISARAHLKRDVDTDLPRDGQNQLRECLNLQIFEITRLLSG